MADLLCVPLGERNSLTWELYSEQLSFGSVGFVAFYYICAVSVLAQLWYETWWSCQFSWGNHCLFFQILAIGNSSKVCMELPLIMCLWVPSPHPSAPDPATAARSWISKNYGVRRHCLSRGDACLWKAFTSSIFWPTVSSWLLWALLTHL